MHLGCGTGLAVVDAEVNDAELWKWKGRLGGGEDCEAVGLNLLMRSWMPEFRENVWVSKVVEVVMTGCCVETTGRDAVDGVDWGSSGEDLGVRERC